MIKNILYYLLRAYVQAGLFFYFRKLLVKGKENIPKGKAVMFLPNHQNAFLDALVIVSCNARITHFVARADVFTNKVAKWLLELINLMPIYRMRDGWQSLGKNQSIFEKCFAILKKKEALMMFPEGNHGDQRRLRPLSKGFTRVAFGTQQVDPDTELFIIPVGINYDRHKRFRGNVSIYYGAPILISDFYSEGSPQEANLLRAAVAKEMKTLITHIEEEGNYSQIISKLNARNPDYLDPIATNQMLTALHKDSEQTTHAHSNRMKSPLYPLSWLNNMLIILFWQLLEKKIKDPVFTGSLKFCFGITIVPLIYLLQASLIGFFAGYAWSVGYLILCLLLAPHLSIKKS